MPDLNSTNSGSYGPGDLPIIPWVYIQRQASVLINKWWSVQVRLQIYDAVECRGPLLWCQIQPYRTPFTIEGTRVEFRRFYLWLFIHYWKWVLHTEKKRNSKENHHRWCCLRGENVSWWQDRGEKIINYFQTMNCRSWIGTDSPKIWKSYNS